MASKLTISSLLAAILISTSGLGSTLQADHYVSLSGGQGPNEGNVFAYNPLTDVYGPVCDDFWDLNDATVVCRQLGFEDVEFVCYASYFGAVPAEFAYDNVNCVGDEETLNDCNWIGYSDCGTDEGAGVICKP